MMIYFLENTIRIVLFITFWLTFNQQYFAGDLEDNLSIKQGIADSIAVLTIKFFGGFKEDENISVILKNRHGDKKIFSGELDRVIEVELISSEVNHIEIISLTRNKRIECGFFIEHSKNAFLIVDMNELTNEFFLTFSEREFDFE